MQSYGDVPSTIERNPVMVRVILMHCKNLRQVWPRGFRLLLEDGFEDPFLTNSRHSWGDKVQYAAGTAEVGTANAILSTYMTLELCFTLRQALSWSHPIASTRENARPSCKLFVRLHCFNRSPASMH